MLGRGTLSYPCLILVARNATFKAQPRIFESAYVTYEFAGDPTKPVTPMIAQTRRSVRELTKVGEREIHEVVLSCTRPAPFKEL